MSEYDPTEITLHDEAAIQRENMDADLAKMKAEGVERSTSEDLPIFEKEFLDKDPTKEQEQEQEDPIAAYNRRRAEKIAKEQPYIQQNLPQQQKSLYEPLDEEAQLLACRKFYDDLISTGYNIIEKKDLNFDCVEISRISDIVNEIYKKEFNIDTSSEEFTIFINNGGEQFKVEDFNLETPIFNKVASEINIYSLFLNDEHIIEYGNVIGSNKKATRSDSSWFKETFIPDLLAKYTIAYGNKYDNEKFNIIFIQLLISLLGDKLFDTIMIKLGYYDIQVREFLKEENENTLSLAENYVKKNSKNLSILFNIPEDKLEENILKTRTAKINFNSEDIIITKTSTYILFSSFLNEQVIGIQLFKNTYNLTKNEKKESLICRIYVPLKDKIEYRPDLIYSFEKHKNQDAKRLLDILNCIQEKKLSEIHKEKRIEEKREKINTVCDNTLNMFFEDLKQFVGIVHFLEDDETNSIEIIKYPKFNFDLIVNQKLDSYLESLFKYINAKKSIFDYDENYNSFLLDLANKCSNGTFDRDYLLKYFENRNRGSQQEIEDKYGEQLSKLNTQERAAEIIKLMAQEVDPEIISKMGNFLRIQGMEISSFDKIIVNGEIIFDKKTSTITINGDKIDRNNGLEFFVKNFFPKLYDILQKVEGVSDETSKFDYCQKFTKRIMGILLLISNTDIASNLSTATTNAIKIDNLVSSLEYCILNDVNIAGISFSKEIQRDNPETIDTEKKKKIAKAFGMSFNTIDNILSSNEIIINVTKSNLTLKSHVNYLMQTKLTGDNLKEKLMSVTETKTKTKTEPELDLNRNVNNEMSTMGIMIVTNNFNFENNTFETIGKMRWIAYNSIFKLILKILKETYTELMDDEEKQKVEKIMSYYRCINLNELSQQELLDIGSGAENNDWSEINLTKTEKIKQKLDEAKEKYSELKEDYPKTVMTAKAIGSVGTAVGLGIAGMAIAGIALSSVLGGKKSKKNMKRNIKNKNKKTTRNYKKQNARKKTRKGVKRAKKIRNTKKQMKIKSKK
jgi:hypothetical protein